MFIRSNRWTIKFYSTSPQMVLNEYGLVFRFQPFSSNYILSFFGPRKRGEKKKEQFHLLFVTKLHLFCIVAFFLLAKFWIERYKSPPHNGCFTSQQKSTLHNLFRLSIPSCLITFDFRSYLFYFFDIETHWCVPKLSPFWVKSSKQMSGQKSFME